MSYEKLLDATISTESAKAWRESGKKAVGTVCCHVPHEIIYAAGISRFASELPAVWIQAVLKHG
jgi:benzoyl-CoA reductase/2-hydroxyglutaryl-CoA dehydratase subunit BcrC/BadD/HgdB